MYLFYTKKFFVAVKLRRELARVVKRCDDIEREAVAKAQRQFKAQADAMEKELRAAKKAQEEADQKRKDAEEARAAAEIERDQLTEEQLDSANDLLAELRHHNKRLNPDYDDDEAGPSTSKKKKAKSSELFTVDGELKVPPQYNGQNMTELVMHSQVPSELVEQIGSNTFFELSQMFSGEELTTTQVGNLEIKSKGNPKQITKKSEIFFLLYQWGMYYLQVYPEKAAGFLE